MAHATLASQSPSRFLLLIKNYNQISLIGEYRSTSSRDFSAIHFRDRFIRQVSCYTLLSGFRLPWPPSCCLNESTPFLASLTLALRHLNSPFGSSHIASSAYQIWPTCDLLYSPRAQCSNKDHSARKSTTSKFENKSRILNPRTAELSSATSNHSLYLIQLSKSHSNPEGKFGGNQLLDGSISLSPLYPNLTSDLHVNTASSLHQDFS